LWELFTQVEGTPGRVNTAGRLEKTKYEKKTGVAMSTKKRTETWKEALEPGGMLGRQVGYAVQPAQPKEIG